MNKRYMLKQKRPSFSLFPSTFGNADIQTIIKNNTMNAKNHTIEVDAKDLDVFVNQTLSPLVMASATNNNNEYSNEETAGAGATSRRLVEQLQVLTHNLAEHYQALGQQLCNAPKQQQECSHCNKSKLNELALCLQSVIAATTDLPADITAEAHSWIGLLRQKQGAYEDAIKSYMKVLWLQSCSLEQEQQPQQNKKPKHKLLPTSKANSSTQEVKIALTEHRLGLAYGKSGRFSDAVQVLQDVLSKYEKAHVSPDQDVYKCAKAALADFREAQLVEATLLVEPHTTTTITSPGRKRTS